MSDYDSASSSIESKHDDENNNDDDVIPKSGLISMFYVVDVRFSPKTIILYSCK
jgi:hypothetical protein